MECALVHINLSFSDNTEVYDNCAILLADEVLQEFGFINFLLCQLQQERQKRHSVKKLLDHSFLSLPLEAEILKLEKSGVSGSLNQFCLFKSVENLKNFVTGLKGELEWNNIQIASFLLRIKFNNVKEILMDLTKNGAILAAAAVLKEEKHDTTDEALKELLTTSLVSSAANGETRKVKLLCESGVNLNVKNSDGTTALLSASSRGHYSTVEYLIKEAKADVKITDNVSHTALHKAAKSGHTDIVKLLCQSGAEINKRDIISFTPLHYASARGHVSTVDLLLKMGADKAIKDSNGDTAKEVAGMWCDDAEKEKQIKSFWEMSNEVSRLGIKTSALIMCFIIYLINI